MTMEEEGKNSFQFFMRNYLSCAHLIATTLFERIKFATHELKTRKLSQFYDEILFVCCVENVRRSLADKYFGRFHFVRILQFDIIPVPQFDRVRCLSFEFSSVSSSFREFLVLPCSIFSIRLLLLSCLALFNLNSNHGN